MKQQQNKQFSTTAHLLRTPLLPPLKVPAEYVCTSRGKNVKSRTIAIEMFYLGKQRGFITYQVSN